MRFAEGRSILGSVLVSPCYTDMGIPSETISGWYDTPWQWDKIKQNQQFIIQFSSRDDPIVPIAEQEYVQKSKRIRSTTSLVIRGILTDCKNFPSFSMRFSSGFVMNKRNNKEYAQKPWYISFTYRDFRFLWVGELISSVGTNMQYVALSWQLYLLTHSALALGLIGVARFLPILFLSLLGGNFADVHNRKRILYVTQAVIFISSFLLAITTFTNTISVPLMYALTAFVAGATSFDLPQDNRSFQVL